MCDTYQKLNNEGGGATFKWMKCHLIEVGSRVLKKKMIKELKHIIDVLLAILDIYLCRYKSCLLCNLANAFIQKDKE
jgi:hypothetical protein